MNVTNATQTRNGAEIYILAGRLHDFTIGVTNTLPTTTTGPEKLPHQVCLEYNGRFPTTSEMLNCTTIARGRYLFVQFRKHGGYLLLCEVEVYCKFINAKSNRMFLVVALGTI